MDKHKKAYTKNKAKEKSFVDLDAQCGNLVQASRQRAAQKAGRERILKTGLLLSFVIIGGKSLW